MENESKFTGNGFEYFCLGIMACLIIFCTMGIASPWAFCMIWKWQITNTTIEGRKLGFIGKGSSLFWNWIKWYLLCIITLSIYSLWLPVKLERWKVKNTYFVN